MEHLIHSSSLSETPFDAVRHIGTHDNARPFACQLCPKEFAKNASLQAHMKKMHKSEVASKPNSPPKKGSVVANAIPIISTIPMRQPGGQPVYAGPLDAQAVPCSGSGPVAVAVKPASPVQDKSATTPRFSLSTVPTKTGLPIVKGNEARTSLSSVPGKAPSIANIPSPVSTQFPSTFAPAVQCIRPALQTLYAANGVNLPHLAYQPHVTLWPMHRPQGAALVGPNPLLTLLSQTQSQHGIGS